MKTPKLERMDGHRWRIRREGGMRVDGIVFADDRMIDDLRGDQSLQQVANVAHLPGIVKASYAMPDIHWGYGFPIGGVAAMDAEEGVISPGGVGYDINCGVRLLRSRLRGEDLDMDARRLLVDALYDRIPTGVGRGRADLRLDPGEMRRMLDRGASWAVDRGLGQREDLAVLEAGGRLPEADPEAVSERACQRGADQLGTLGSGNHFAEIQVVEEICEREAGDAFGLHEGEVTILLHSGSRGLGHQTCTDHLKIMQRVVDREGIDLPDRQLCCAPLRSPEGKAYLGAMAAAANFAFANRQVMTHFVREAFETALGLGPAEHGIEVVYDVCHNIAKLETFEDVGRVCVHRKGATRAYPPGHPEVPEPYRGVGQPVMIPGDMGRCSWVLAGDEGAWRETFGSSCHGAGRRMSRRQAKKAARGRKLIQELEDRGVAIRAAGMSTVAEEMPEAYKDVSEVVEVVAKAGLCRKVAKLRPIGVIKG